MRVAFGLMAVGCLLSAGCSNQPSNASKPADAAVVAEAAGRSTATGSTATGSTATTEQNSSGTAAAAANAAPVRSGVAKLTPENTKIQFVGTHAGGEPNPRTGGFEKFAGEAELDADGKTLKSVSIEIETGSLWTQHGRLTQHLNTPDFFDTREYPTAAFESTRIQPAGGDGQYTIVGDLMLLETTKEIQFPAAVTIDDAGLALRAAFTIDRTEFGMDKLQDRVENPVDLTVVIGEKTEPLPSADRPRGGGPGAGGFDPAAFFKQLDANGDGKLASDEIPDPMRQNITAIDANGDGEITQQEFQARMRQRGGGRGPGVGGGPGPSGRPAGAAEPGDAAGADDRAQSANEADDADAAADDEAGGTQQAGTRNEAH
ncbi:MAG: YceI family protein [Pirellulales bacterium]